jgi:hypothetical protein
MSDKMYIRVKADGFIYEYNETLARNPGCEVVPEQVAYPERFIDEEVGTRIKRRKSSKGGLDLATDIPEEPVYTDPELAAEAGRGFPE